VDAREEETSIPPCTSGHEVCPREADCTIREPMHKLQATMQATMNAVTIAQLM